MVRLIVACIGVTAGSVAVLQFFFALEQSARSAAEATWVVKVFRLCQRTWRRSRERLAPLWRRRQNEAAASWLAEVEHRPWRASRQSAEAPPGADGSDRTAPPRAATTATDLRGGDEVEGVEANGATWGRRATALAAAFPARLAANGRSHWVWGTRPDFYAESDGTDRLDLEPSVDFEPRGWGRCDEETRTGDLVLVYRTAPRKDLRYLLEVLSDAYPLEGVVGPSGGHGCDYRVLHKLDPPISLAELRADPVTSGWPALRVNFRRCQPVPPEVWERLATMMADHDPRAGRVLRKAARGPGRERPLMKFELESRLFSEPQRLSRIGLDVEAVGRRIRDPHGGLLDILFRDKHNGDYVVVALKPGRGAPAAVTRLLEDVATVPDLYETPRSVRGLLIAADLDQRAERMLRGAGNLEFARLDDLGLPVHAG